MPLVKDSLQLWDWTNFGCRHLSEHQRLARQDSILTGDTGKQFDDCNPPIQRAILRWREQFPAFRSQASSKAEFSARSDAPRCANAVSVQVKLKDVDVN
jgi:hypothetical protein